MSVKMPCSMKFWKLLQAKRASNVWLHDDFNEEVIKKSQHIVINHFNGKDLNREIKFALLGMVKSCDIVNIVNGQIYPWVL